MTSPRCERCFERGWTRPSNPANQSQRYFDQALCDDCVDTLAEAANERQSVWRDAATPFAKNH